MELTLTIHNAESARQAIELLNVYLAQEEKKQPASPLGETTLSCDPELDINEMHPGLGVRTINLLRDNGIATLGQLLSRTEEGLLSINGFGQACLKDVKSVLAERGLTLATQKPR